MRHYPVLSEDDHAMLRSIICNGNATAAQFGLIMLTSTWSRGAPLTSNHQLMHRLLCFRTMTQQIDVLELPKSDGIMSNIKLAFIKLLYAVRTVEQCNPEAPKIVRECLEACPMLQNGEPQIIYPVDQITEYALWQHEALTDDDARLPIEVAARMIANSGLYTLPDRDDVDDCMREDVMERIPLNSMRVKDFVHACLKEFRGKKLPSSLRMLCARECPEALKPDPDDGPMLRCMAPQTWLPATDAVTLRDVEAFVDFCVSLRSRVAKTQLKYAIARNGLAHDAAKPLVMAMCRLEQLMEPLGGVEDELSLSWPKHKLPDEVLNLLPAYEGETDVVTRYRACQ